MKYTIAATWRRWYAVYSIGAQAAMAWLKQQHGQQLRHVGQNRKQEDGATTLEEGGNDR